MDSGRKSFVVAGLITHTVISILVLLCLLAFNTHARAQEVPTDTAQANAPAWPEDSLGRRTPRGTVQGFIKAVADQNYNQAAQYLHIDSTLANPLDGSVLAKALQQLMDRTGRLMPFAWMSDSYDGSQSDNLGPNLDKIGTITIESEEVDLIVEKITGPEGGPIWLFSSQTVQRIPLPVEETTTAPIVDKVIPEPLEDRTWSGVPIGHWFGIVLLAVAAYYLSKGIITLILWLLPRVWKRARVQPTSGVIRAFSVPLRIYLAVWVFVVLSRYVGISIILRLRLSEITVIAGIVAFLLLVWHLIEFLSEYFERRLARRGNVAGVSAVLFLRRGIKVGLFVLGVILALDTFGFDVTAGLAALGIGGIALALGAQKTVENLVGSITLIADQPVRVGDFCKVGNVSGTIEQIGMRSTRIRTGNRTVVTIPNGEFSSMHIENFAPRDQYLLDTVIRLRYDTTPDQIRYLLVELRTLLYAHPKVDPNPARIRFTTLAVDSLNLEVYAYINAKDFDEFLGIREDLYLRMMDVIKASGTSLALPSQAVYLAKDMGLAQEQAQQVASTVKQWREANEMPLPGFNEERIQQLRNTIPYPPEGSSSKPA